ncbi:MAG: hypothetical protein ABI054_03110, partial [Planctomycetota bacterium]
MRPSILFATVAAAIFVVGSASMATDETLTQGLEHVACPRGRAANSLSTWNSLAERHSTKEGHGLAPRGLQ